MAPPTIRTESEARTLLETYRAEGLTFIQVRRHDSRGKFHVVCALCGTDRDNDEEMRDHLTTWIHQTMLEMAQKTLFKNNPWPFDDGYIFYHGEQAEGQYLEPPNDSHVGYRNLKRVGYGEIAASLDEVGEKISKIWCEFLGNNGVHDHLEPSDFDIVTFPFTAKLGNSERPQVYKLACDFCNKFIYEGKDASTLLNTRTRELACTGAVDNIGAFDVFHTRCVLLWLLIFEYHGMRAFCPGCYGIGVLPTEGETRVRAEGFGRVEHIFKNHVNQCEQYRHELPMPADSWLYLPEPRENPTIGLTFYNRFGEHPTDKQMVVRIRSITFYRAEENQLLPAQ